MITFNNKSDKDVLIKVNAESVSINAHNSCQYMNIDNNISFSIYNEINQDKTFGAKILYVLFMCFISLILFIFEESMYSSIDKYIELPINVD